MEVTVHHLGNVKFEAVARGHRVMCDQPPANGGADTGMTPPEFLLVSLGTCAGYYAAEYLKARSLPTTGLEIKVSAEKAHAAGAAGCVSHRGGHARSGPASRGRPVPRGESAWSTTR